MDAARWEHRAETLSTSMGALTTSHIFYLIMNNREMLLLPRSRTPGRREWPGNVAHMMRRFDVKCVRRRKIVSSWGISGYF